jgi:hypothetical protein
MEEYRKAADFDVGIREARQRKQEIFMKFSYIARVRTEVKYDRDEERGQQCASGTAYTGLNAKLRGNPCQNYKPIMHRLVPTRSDNSLGVSDGRLSASVPDEANHRGTTITSDSSVPGFHRLDMQRYGR